MGNNKKGSPKPRNMIAYAMITNPRRHTAHGDARKEASRKGCRGKVKID